MRNTPQKSHLKLCGAFKSSHTLAMAAEEQIISE
jgi:hypothetical protein